MLIPSPASAGDGSSAAQDFSRSWHLHTRHIQGSYSRVFYSYKPQAGHLQLDRCAGQADKMRWRSWTMVGILDPSAQRTVVINQRGPHTDTRDASSTAGASMQILGEVMTMTRNPQAKEVMRETAAPTASGVGGHPSGGRYGPRYHGSARIWRLVDPRIVPARVPATVSHKATMVRCEPFGLGCGGNATLGRRSRGSSETDSAVTP